MAQQTVEIVHPDGMEARVLPASVGVYIRAGWTLKPIEDDSLLSDNDKALIALATGKSPEPASAPADTAVGTDPGNVVEVTDAGAAGQPVDNGNSGATTEPSFGNQK